MGRYYRPILATRVDLVEPTEVKPRCRGCGLILHDPRTTTTHCASCRMTQSFMDKCEQYGIDLASLADDEIVVWRETKGEGRRLVVVKDDGKRVAA